MKNIFNILILTAIFIYTVTNAEQESVLGTEIEHAILDGKWDQAHNAVREAKQKGVNIDSYVIRAIASVRKKLDELHKMVFHTTSNDAPIAPAFQWAQSSEAIFLNIKLSTRWDSPGAINIENEKVDVTEGSFHFSCFANHNNFELNLQLYESINTQAVDWAVGSVGKITVTLRKQDVKMWKHLLKSTVKLPNMYIWWEMNERLGNSITSNMEEQAPIVSKSNETSQEKNTNGEL